MNKIKGSDTLMVSPRLLEADNETDLSLTQVADQVAEEVAIALVFNGLSHAVMMATPDNLEDFALGFSLSEGIIQRPQQLYDIEVVEQERGIELQLEITSECFIELKRHRRHLAGRTGCGLCGVESLQQVLLPPGKVVSAPIPSVTAIEMALEQFKAQQPLQAVTGAVHGAALCDETGQILLLREDVGRHNALDKLIGAYKKAPQLETHGLFVLISSRASYEMVNKCASAGIPSLVAVSAATTLAVEQAKTAGINLIGFTRPGRHVVYT